MLVAFLIISLSYADDMLHEGIQLQKSIEIGDIQKFKIDLSTLSKNSKYEARISYLGTVGCNFKIWWNCEINTGRRLLDTEKLIFSTDDIGNIIGSCDMLAIMAIRDSRSFNKAVENQPVWYNIKLERYDNLLKVPRSVIDLITIGIFVLIGIGLLFFYTHKYFNTNSENHSNKIH